MLSERLYINNNAMRTVRRNVKALRLKNNLFFQTHSSRELRKHYPLYIKAYVSENEITRDGSYLEPRAHADIGALYAASIRAHQTQTLVPTLLYLIKECL